MFSGSQTGYDAAFFSMSFTPRHIKWSSVFKSTKFLKHIVLFLKSHKSLIFKCLCANQDELHVKEKHRLDSVVSLKQRAFLDV